MSQLYLGKVFDPASRGLGDRFTIDPEDLTTHGLIVGMTGSGKTGFSAVIIEECLRAGIPVIAIDPKGDLSNLALSFDRLDPGQFREWVDVVAAQREGRTPDEAAAEAAASWTKGLAEWGVGPADIAGYNAGHDVRILTPGSTAGVPLSLVDSLEPPADEILGDAEEFRDQVDGVVTALLGLVEVDADPVRSREYMLLHALVGAAWQERRTLSLESLIGEVARPPFDRLGALPLDTVYPEADRRKLMLALNGILASPQMEAWRQGEPVDIDRWLHGPDGRPRLTIIYTAHLEDRERLSVTALVLNRVKSWMRRQPGTGELRCLVYMDEIFGYFPPTENPPTKKPLLTLLKQARAFGVGVLLATQNPVDLDYKGLANMGFWAIGRLQTTQDQERVREGVEAALAGAGLGFDFDTMIAGVQKRVFLVHDIHRKAPALVHTRWAMSYLRGPLTRDEIARLAQAGGMRAEAGSAGAVGSTDRPPATARPAASAAAPVIEGLPSRYLRRFGGTMANPYVYVRAAVRYKAGSVLTEEAVRDLAFPLGMAASATEVMEAEPLEVDPDALGETPPAGLGYGSLPSFLDRDGARALERALRDRLDDRLAVTLWYDPVTKTLSQPGESQEALSARVNAIPTQSQKRDRLETRLQQRRMQLAAKKEEKKGRRMEKWVSLGTAILSNVAIFTGRKRTVTGAGSVLTKNRMETTTGARIEQLEADVAQIEAELAELQDVDPRRFEERLVKPAKADVALIRYELAWVY